MTAPAEPTEPDISFSGMLAPKIQPAEGAPVWILDMLQAGVEIVDRQLEFPLYSVGRKRRCTVSDSVPGSLKPLAAEVACNPQ